MGQWVTVGTAHSRAFYLYAGQRVLVHKSLDKLLRPDVSQPFLHGEGEEESGNGKLWGGSCLWGPGMVLLPASCFPAHPGRPLGTSPSHWGSATLFCIVTELSSISEGSIPSFPILRGCLSSWGRGANISIGDICDTQETRLKIE